MSYLVLTVAVAALACIATVQMETIEPAATCKDDRNKCKLSRNEVCSDCASLCQAQCKKTPIRFCPALCKVGCVCQKGFIRDDQGRCVQPIQCKPRISIYVRYFHVAIMANL